jgi:hypothetical protein
MSTTKLVDNNRRAHAIKVLAEKSKKQSHLTTLEDDSSEGTNVNQVMGIPNLQDQYQLIRNDVLKLREDLGVGYDMLRIWMRDHFNLKTALRFNR